MFFADSVRVMKRASMSSLMKGVWMTGEAPAERLAMAWPRRGAWASGAGMTALMLILAEVSSTEIWARANEESDPMAGTDCVAGIASAAVSESLESETV